MRFEVTLKKDGLFWLGEVRALDILTQGHTKKECLKMVLDVLKSYINDESFSAQIVTSKYKTLNLGYLLQSDNQDLLISLLLKRQRQKHGLTLQDMASRLGSSSINSFARYEQGKASPTLKKLEQLMTAISPDLEPILRIQD
ncbi:MAG: helix-turn-helix transcriptional regulator [Bdellovibrionota bacterium]